MSNPQEPERVKLITAATYRDGLILDRVMETMQESYGKIDFVGDEYDFNFTEYYSDEMGQDLRKRLISFRELIFPETITEVKWFLYRIENKLKENNKRKINLDPGYMTRNNFVLVTFKNSPHRIYIRDNVYAEIELLYESGSFQELKWTYPDYRLNKVKENLKSIRDIYLPQLREYRRHKDV